MLTNSALVSTVALAVLVAAAPTPAANQYQVSTVHQFPNGSWIENFVVRQNGHLVATDLDRSQIYLIDPKKPQDAPVVARFPNNTALTGIVELCPDLFYTQGIINSDVSAFSFPLNSSFVWEVDMRDYDRTGQAAVREVAKVSEVGIVNGMTVLSEQDRTVLIADSLFGQIYSLDVSTGKYKVIVDDPLLKNVPGSEVPFGVNGVFVTGSTLYFSNTNQGLIGTFPIARDGHATGPGKVISNQTPNADDFAVDQTGSVWITDNQNDLLRRVTPDGQVQVVAGANDFSLLAAPVSARFGKGRNDRDTLYISTDGLLVDQKTGEPLRSDGKIAAIKTKDLGIDCPTSH